MTADFVPISLPLLPERPLVSVLVASYNYEAYLGEALESLCRQSYTHFEAIVCDDGSTDRSPEIAADFARRDERFRLIRKENGGVASALNAAYRASTGEIVCLLDADDVFAPEKLERVVDFLRHHPTVGLGQHALQCIDGVGEPLHRLPFAGAHESGWIAERLRSRGGRWRSLPTSALFFRRALAECVFPLPEEAFRSEADAFIVALAPLLTPVGFLPEALVQYRLHGQNLTSTHRRDRRATVRMLDALRRVNQAVNERAAALGLGDEVFRLRDHVNYREQVLALALIDAAPLAERLRLYADLARVLLTDDLYAPARKAWGLFTFGVALVLPVRWRIDWLSHVHKARPIRRVLSCLLH